MTTPDTLPRWIAGGDLRVGDTIAVWWSPGRDTITGLKPYSGSLAPIFAPDGASIAAFALGGGMTIEHGLDYQLLARPEGT